MPSGLQIVDKLLYPMILGNNFLQQQGMVIDYQKREKRWDDFILTMDTKPELEVRVEFVAVDEDERMMQILDVTGKEIDLKSLILKEHLSDEHKGRLFGLLQSFRIVTAQGIGRLNRRPYVLPIKPGCRSCTYKPYPIPIIHREAVK